MVCSISPVRDGPEMKLTARGKSPCSLRSSAKASSMVGTRRDSGINAMCVSGSRLTVAGVSGPESSISVPVSAMAQKQLVTPTLSASPAPRDAAMSAWPAQSSRASSGETTREQPRSFAAKNRATVAGTSTLPETCSTLLDSVVAHTLKRSARSSPSTGCGPRSRLDR